MQSKLSAVARNRDYLRRAGTMLGSYIVGMLSIPTRVMEKDMILLDENEKDRRGRGLGIVRIL